MTVQICLGAYPAKRCARATHYMFSPKPPPRTEPDADALALREQGVLFEEEITGILAGVPGTVVLDSEDGWAKTVKATVDAMRRRVPVIVGGRLPNTDTRKGAPDVLVMTVDGYVPVDIKSHGTRNDSPRKSLMVSSFGTPAQRHSVKGLSDSWDRWYDDGLQLAHYTRMLQELGFHAGDGHLIGGVIGRSEFSEFGGCPWLIVWLDLDSPCKDTYSASSETHRAKRSLLERYDHEFGFRLKVAEAARRGEELVRTFHISECSGCEWRDYCAENAPENDASFAIGIELPSAQQWRQIYDTGVKSIADLAALDPDSQPENWGKRTTRTGRGEGGGDAWAKLIRRARLVEDGRHFEPLDGDWPEVPSADVEIDFDLEWDDTGIYLWGLRVRQGQDGSTADYKSHSVYSFDPNVDDTELAAEVAKRLRAIIAEADANGQTVKVFHWSHPERTRTERFPDLVEVLHPLLYDLGVWFKENFLSARGWSIKYVAPLFDFHWAVESAGGLNSMEKIKIARGEGPEAEAARDWLLRYNECDVAAQAAIRDGIRARIAKERDQKQQ